MDSLVHSTHNPGHSCYDSEKEGYMVTYKNILFCTDFSENAQAALPFAIDLAKKYGAMFHVLHVFEEPLHVVEFEIISNTKMDWIRIGQMEKKLEALCKKITLEVGLCHSELLRGRRAHSEIFCYAKKANIDLIVMGSHSLSGWQQVLWGSTAERVLRESPCHVLVIRRPG